MLLVCYVDGKQIWKPLFAETFAQAKKEVRHLTNGIPPEAQGFSVVQRDLPRIVNCVPLATAVETYLEQKSGKSQKTVYQYQRTLNEFQAVVGRKVRYLDEVTENTLRTYKKSMEAEGTPGKPLTHVLTC